MNKAIVIWILSYSMLNGSTLNTGEVPFATKEDCERAGMATARNNAEHLKWTCTERKDK